MASSKAATVEEYLAELPADRRAVIAKVPVTKPIARYEAAQGSARKVRAASAKKKPAKKKPVATKKRSR